MARPDSTLVGHLVDVLNAPRKVVLLPGDRIATGLVRDLLVAKNIEIIKDSDPASRPGVTSAFPISVPEYMVSADLGRVVFNEMWNRPLIVAQAVGEALQSWPTDALKELMLGSGWLWWAMSCRKWRDINNLRDFVSWSLELARARSWRFVDESHVLAEFDQSGQLECLFTVDADLSMAYYPPWENYEPVPRSRFKHPDDSLLLPYSPNSLRELIKRHWDWYATGALNQIVLPYRATWLRQTDVYSGFPILPKDVLPYLKTLEWWELRIGEKQEDDLSILHQRDFGPVQAYCRGRWSGHTKRKLARKFKWKVWKLRRWRWEVHLETEFGGKDDGHEQWTAARERLRMDAGEVPVADVPSDGQADKHGIRVNLRSLAVTFRGETKGHPGNTVQALVYFLDMHEGGAECIDRLDLLEQLGITRKKGQPSVKMRDVFRNSPFYDRNSESWIVKTAEEMTGQRAKNKYYLDVDFKKSSVDR